VAALAQIETPHINFPSKQPASLVVTPKEGAALSSTYPSIPISLLLLHRVSSEQGTALQILAHASDYLTHSRIFLTEHASFQSDVEACGILLRMSRTIFVESQRNS
jgi:hypothetical protein